MKTLIELFDSCQIENVIAGLRFLPEKIVFVGFKEIMTKKRISDLERFFSSRKMNVSLEYKIVERYNYAQIEETLYNIIDNNEDCCFDLTGGKELILTAMGAVSAVRNIPMLQFNVRSGNLIKIKNCGNISETAKSSMLIKESVILNGGSVVYNDKDEFSWQLCDDFKKDIESIWQICKKNCGLWNRQSLVFKNFEKFGQIDKNFCVRVNLKYMKDAKQDVLLNQRIITSLIKDGLIYDYSEEDGKLTFKYKNEQVYQCISKAGNILELYVYMAAHRIAESDPDYYDDIDIGVIVDWDGVIHESGDFNADTKNEIDVMMMRDLVPIFISCKNGEVRKEALYELNTVAGKFGGEYAKKILLTTYITTDADSRKYILQRARDMKIDIIEGVDKMNRDEFIATIRRRVK